MLIRRGLLSLAIIGAVSAVVPSVAGATAIQVNNFTDAGASCTLRNAITAANTNAASGACPAGQGAGNVDVISFPTASASTIALGTALPAINGPLTITGPGPTQLTVSGGGAVRPFVNNSTATISGLTVANGLCSNACGAQGGGINNSGTLTLDDVVLHDNIASAVNVGMNSFAEGGAIENGGGATLTITDSEIRNSAVIADNATGQNGAGGGAIINRGTLSVTRTTIAQNVAGATATNPATNNVTGGGISNNGALTIVASTINNNSANVSGSGSGSATGGGISQFNNPANSLSIDRSTISGNSAETNAGGIQSIGAPGFVTNSTIFANSAPSGANLTLSAPLTVSNTIISNPAVGPNCSNAGLISAGFNLESTNLCGLNQPSDLTSTNPMLGALVDNGGPTFTRAPTPGSPVIDAGRAAGAALTDQRGLLRPSDVDSIADAAGGDGSDIGAVEIQDSVAPDTTITSGPGSANGKGVSFAFSSSEKGSKFECAVDGGSFAACASPNALASLSDGSHTFAVRAVDGTGNADATPASRSFPVDTTAPKTKLGKFKKKTTKTKVKLKFSSEKGATFECRVDSKPFKTCKSPFKTKKLKLGKHVIEVRATDATGNTEAKPARAKFKVVS